MKIIDHAYPVKTGRSRSGLERWLKRLPSRRYGSPEERAQETLIKSLNRMLGHQYVLLRGILLEGLGGPIPLTLLGPVGVLVIQASAERGLFRANDESWERMDDRLRRFRQARPNLIARTLLNARALQSYLAANGFPILKVEPVLYFSHPGTHIDAIRPAVRLVLADAVERFAAGLAQATPVLSPEDIPRIVDLLIKPQEPAAEPITDSLVKDDFSLIEEIVPPPREPQASLAESRFSQDTVSALNRIPFNTRQWLLLGILMLVNVMILIGFVVLVLLTS